MAKVSRARQIRCPTCADVIATGGGYVPEGGEVMYCDEECSALFSRLGKLESPRAPIAPHVPRRTPDEYEGRVVLYGLLTRRDARILAARRRPERR